MVPRVIPLNQQVLSRSLFFLFSFSHLRNLSIPKKQSKMSYGGYQPGAPPVSGYPANPQPPPNLIQQSTIAPQGYGQPQQQQQQPPPQQQQYPPPQQQQQYPPPQQQYPPPQQQYPPPQQQQQQQYQPPQQQQQPPPQQYPPQQPSQYQPPQQQQPPPPQAPPQQYTPTAAAPVATTAVVTPPAALHGVLEVHIMECEYPKRGFFRGFGNDPYVNVRLGTMHFKTRVYDGPDKATRATFFEKFDFSITNQVSLQLEILDKDDLTPDSLIGMCNVEVNKVPDGAAFWVPLTKRDRSTSAGRLQISLRLKPPATHYAHAGVYSPYTVPATAATTYTTTTTYAPATQIIAGRPVYTPGAVYAAPYPPPSQPVYYPQPGYPAPAAVPYAQPPVVYQQPGVVYQQPGVVYQQPSVVYQAPGAYPPAGTYYR